MKAVVLEKCCTPEEMEIKEVEIPKVKKGWVLVKVKAFGTNHSEVLLRKNEVEAPYINKPIIPGIECVGEIVDKSDSRFKNGQKVIALMGGMGRSFNGSYLEYALLPEKNVFSVDTDLTWEELGAIPETFFTAYGSLFDCMQIKRGETVLIRGGTSSVGMAAIQLAKAVGCRVYATVLNKNKTEILKKCGADEVVIDDGTLKKQMAKLEPNGLNNILELVGAKTLKESMDMTSYHGIVCYTGILGGVYTLDGFDPIKEIPNGVYLTSFYSNYPTQEKINEIFNLITTHNIKPVIGKVYKFSEIKEVHKNMEEHKVTGKNVVIVE